MTLEIMLLMVMDEAFAQENVLYYGIGSTIHFQILYTLTTRY